MTDEEIERIASGFCARTLPKEEWTHGAHFATALWLMLRRTDMLAERDMPGMIAAYNESMGGVNSDSAGYHETITMASLKAARAVLAGLPGEPSPAEVFAALMRSPMADKDWLFAYWSRERLMSTEARRRWVEPDLTPLPWA
ncbi:hypothetical protein A0J57_16645 [Sphingobium sp. 22B]|uniref:hypothetical protein n=1 Tax=unclassified Sphingobium TaxID=2611147 RepID=UPI0007854FA7|nr:MULTISPECIES: hypothetical protein [unclassified Sphingobium]KXU31335.1 hypothetical protein AXW74_13415 [Sphingobium sp. AM]KYC31382.1 hypothetical protein A0J57_16645 [Sphingobium sp. 22B]OAP31264.1 hypothetical protein A8O16_14550 [Sphingobium sp. 20006FA]